MSVDEVFHDATRYGKQRIDEGELPLNDGRVAGTILAAPAGLAE